MYRILLIYLQCISYVIHLKLDNDKKNLQGVVTISASYTLYSCRDENIETRKQ